MICATCKNALGAHYQLNHVNAAGAIDGTVLACSVKCLVGWAYAYGAQRTTMGVMMAKHMFGRVLGALRQTPPNTRRRYMKCEHTDEPCASTARYRVANTGHKSTKTSRTFLCLCEEHAPQPPQRDQWNTVPIEAEPLVLTPQ